MNILTQTVTVLLGLLGGALLLIGLSDYPYWLTLDLGEFNQHFQTSVPFVAGVMKPLGFSTTGLTLLVTALAYWKKLPTRNWLVAASVCVLAMFGTFPIYFSSANAALAAGTFSASEVSQTLKQWQLVHWFRTIAAIAACFCAVRAGYSSSTS